MRGPDEQQEILLVTTTIDEMIPADHPIRRIKPVVDHVLRRLEPTFAKMYSQRGRPSVAPERLLKATVLMALYSIRSERMFCEQLRFNLLFKWFLDLNIDDLGWDRSTFSKNRQRLLEHDVAKAFFREVYEQARIGGYTSDEHFSVDGTLVQAWASMKSFRPIDEQRDDGSDSNSWSTPGTGGRNPDVNYRGQPRKNDTHRSTTDPEARLACKAKGQLAILGYGMYALMENRNGLLTDVELTQPTGTSERETALKLLKRNGSDTSWPRRTVAGDKGFDTKDFVAGCRELRVTPHIAQNTKRWGGGSAIDGRTTHHSGYQESQRRRKRIEEVFGWAKTVGGTRKLRYIGLARNSAWVVMMAACYNLVRIGNLSLEAA